MIHPRVNILLLTGIIAGLVFISSCKRKVICPAYQSVFILDPAVRYHTFSLFGEDSLPKAEVKVDKDPHLVLRAMSKRKKEKSLHTIPMETVFPPVLKLDTVSSTKHSRPVIDTDTLQGVQNPEVPADSLGDGF